MSTLEELLQTCAKLHRHLCPRQVLGVRMGLTGGAWLGLDVPQSGKRLLTIVETDGCGADGIAVATGCWVGRRTLRVFDFGKVAATLIDTKTGRSVRVAPSNNARALARAYAPQAANRWQAYLVAYQKIPDDELLCLQPVQLKLSLAEILSRSGYRVNCVRCGEEIINEREVLVDGQPWCGGCAGDGYYRLTNQPDLLPVGKIAGTEI
jgi:formylmethanofuran dehydrogenase subunit E